MTGRDRRGEVTGPARDELAATFGASLRRHRREAGLTQVQLADRARMNVSTVSRFECGRIRPHWTTIRVLAVAVAVGRSGERARIESDLLTAAGPFVAFAGGGRASRRGKAARSIEALDRAVERHRLTPWAAASDAALIREQIGASLAALERSIPDALTSRSHAP